MPTDDDGLEKTARFIDRKVSGAGSKIRNSLAGTISQGKEKLSEAREERRKNKRQMQARRDRAIQEARREARMEAEKEFGKQHREQFKEQERASLERADRGILGTIGAGLAAFGSSDDDESFLGLAPPGEPLFSGEGMDADMDMGLSIEVPETTIEFDDDFRI